MCISCLFILSLPMTQVVIAEAGIPSTEKIFRQVAGSLAKPHDQNDLSNSPWLLVLSERKKNMFDAG